MSGGQNRAAGIPLLKFEPCIIHNWIQPRLDLNKTKTNTDKLRPIHKKVSKQWKTQGETKAQEGTIPNGKISSS